MPILKSILWYALAVVIFPYSWLMEQPHALKMAWLDSFAEAHAKVREIWRPQ